MAVAVLFDPLSGRAIPHEIFSQAPCARLALHARRLLLPQMTGPIPGATAGKPGPGLALEAPLSADLVALGRWFNASWRVEPLAS